MKELSLIRNNLASFVKTLGCCCVFAATGFQAGIIGPSLFDFKILTNSNSIAQVAWIVTGRGIGVAIGSFLAGTMASFMNLLLVLAFGLVGSGVFYMMMPISVTLIITIIISSLAGVMQGISYAGSNMLILKLWSENCPPFLQAVHLSYGVGAFLSPLWVKHFLLVEQDLHMIEFESHEVGFPDSEEIFNNGNYTKIKHTHEDVQLVYPFIFTAVYPIFSAFLFIFLYYKYPENEVAKKPGTKRVTATTVAKLSVVSETGEDEVNPSTNNNTTRQEGEESDPMPPPRSRLPDRRRQSIVRRDSIINIRRPSLICTQLYSSEIPHIDTNHPFMAVIFIAMTSLMGMIYGGLEQAIGTYIPAFAVKSALKLDKPTGAIISSLYWASITLFQGVAIVAVTLIGVTNILWFDYINAVIAAVVLYFSVHNQYVYWFACAYLGMSFASLWGAFFSFLEPRFNVTNNVVTVLSVSFCVGQSGFTALIGLLIDRYPRSFLYFTLSATITMLLLFIAVFFYSKKFFPERKY